MAPGFIDGHVHIESSHLSPCKFAQLALPCGTTTVIADPHEIVNVCGIEGMDYMIQASENIFLSVFLQFPSCVPATPFENSGAVLNAKDIASRIKHPRVLGLGELMNYAGVNNADSDVLDKILSCKNEGKIIDGHSPGIGGPALDSYSCAGIRNDHECSTAEDLIQRIRRGMFVLLRQGTVCHDLVNLLKGVNASNSDRCLMCTDDCQAHTMIEIGHIDNNIRMAVKEGINPLNAIAMATCNAAECFHLTDRGAIAPGRRADFVLFDSLDNIRPDEVFVLGKQVAAKGKCIVDIASVDSGKVSSKMNIENCNLERFGLKLKSDNIRTIKVIPGSVVTECGNATVKRNSDGFWVRDNQDICKIAVVERHHGTGNIGLALIENLGLKNGAIATSVAHDSHNIVVAGDNDSDMFYAVKELEKVGGGMTVVQNKQVLKTVQHEIAGLMTDSDGESVASELASIVQTAHKILAVNKDIDPFMTLCFMSLPVIPKLKVTDMGLFDVEKFSFVPVEQDR